MPDGPTDRDDSQDTHQAALLDYGRADVGQQPDRPVAKGIAKGIAWVVNCLDLGRIGFTAYFLPTFGNDITQMLVLAMVVGGASIIALLLSIGGLALAKRAQLLKLRLFFKIHLFLDIGVFILFDFGGKEFIRFLQAISGFLNPAVQ